jgi:hypothetical protein
MKSLLREAVPDFIQGLVSKARSQQQVFLCHLQQLADRRDPRYPTQLVRSPIVILQTVDRSYQQSQDLKALA